MLKYILIFSLFSTSALARTYIPDNYSPKRSRVVYEKEASTGIEMRKTRRFGVGLQAAGSLGLGGPVLELNFNPQWGFSGGFGGGDGFQSYKLEGKYILAGEWLLPYFAFGFCNWSSIGNRGPISRSSPAILYDKLLTGDERAAGVYRKNLFYPSFGLQFVQLTGEWAGFSILGEFTALIDVGSFTAAPTGTLAVLYYF